MGEVKIPNPNTSEMTLRDLFAGGAMEGLISNSYYSVDLSGNSVFPVPSELATKSYEIADAMLKARQL